MAKDYYVILGVGSDATLDQIKSAYRKKAKLWHPDVSGEGCEPFLAIQEAYDVLGDAQRRRAYDEDVARQKRMAQQPARQVRPEPMRRRGCPVEPLVPTRRPDDSRVPSGQMPSSSLFTELFGQPWSDVGYSVRSVTGRAAEDIHIEVSLTREQAMRGGRIRLWIPVQLRCPACGGWGGIGFFECRHCLGSGSVSDERPVDIAFAGGLADGFRGKVTLARSGMGDLSLVLHFRVD